MKAKLALTAHGQFDAYRKSYQRAAAKASKSISDDIEFEASKMEIEDGGNIINSIHGLDGVEEEVEVTKKVNKKILWRSHRRFTQDQKNLHSQIPKFAR